MTFNDEVKKQINRQTRENVGSMKIETTSSTFVQQPIPGGLGVDPIITWDKVSYSRDRGEIFVLEPISFNDPLASKSTQSIYTQVGNFTDRARVAYSNVRYSGWAGINGGGNINFRIVAEGSLSVYIDQELIYSSGEEYTQPMDFSISISSRSFIQIYWYAQNEGASFDLSGNISRYLTLWEQSDVTPFWDTVEWYPVDPVFVDQSGGDGVRPIAVVVLKWWFGEDVEVVDVVPLNTDLGGFGLWQVEFQEVGEIDVLGATEISVPGYYPNVKYLKINDLVYKPQRVTSASTQTNTTIFAFEAHGLTDVDDGAIVEIGVLKLLKNMPITEFGLRSDIYETNDSDIVWGETYYYLIDCYDTSPNMNRGGVTEVLQMVTAGDIIPPPSPINLTGVRNAVDSVTLSWDQENMEDVDHWAIFADFDSAEYTPIEGESDYIIIPDIDPFLTAIAATPNGFLISIELAAGGKWVRQVTSVVGSVLYLSEDLPTPLLSNETIRFLSIWTGASNNEPVVPRPPRPPEVVESSVDPERTGEVEVVR